MAKDGDNSSRKIIHVDMDAFFASVEQRDNPQLRGQPVAVGGSAKRGVVAAASYEARQFGVRSAMPSVTAARRCSSLIFVPPRFEVYREVSQHIREVFHRYTHLVEPLSLDEAYLDVTLDEQKIGSATKTAHLITAAIREETGLTASAGVSYNKFLAKIASDQNKPDGIFVIRPHEGARFVSSLPVRRFYGVGPKTAERMAGLGIELGSDICSKDMSFLVEHFGKSADYLYNAARGLDQREVRPDRIRKSVGRERTYSDDIHTDVEMYAALEDVVDSVWERIEKNCVTGRTVTLKIKYADFRQITRSKSCDDYVLDKDQFGVLARELLAPLLPIESGVRLMGLTLSKLSGMESIREIADVSQSIGEQQMFDF